VTVARPCLLYTKTNDYWLRADRHALTDGGIQAPTVCEDAERGWTGLDGQNEWPTTFYPE
jgi:hypothetical protein